MSSPRLLVVLRHRGLIRHFGAALLELARSGVTIRVFAEHSKGFDAEAEAPLLAHPRLSLDPLPTMRSTKTAHLSLRLRQLADTLKFVHPDYAHAPPLRARALAEAPPAIRRLGERLIRRRMWRSARLLARAARALDDVLPVPEGVRKLLDREEPDAVVVSPAVWWGSSQPDYVREANRRGVPTAVWVASWDNLTNKGRINARPDRVVVWNEAQVTELGRYHGLGSDRVAVTGAQTFDQWFGARPQTSRSDFLAGLGLPIDRKLVLYVGSSRQIAPDEPRFFAEWLRCLRSCADVRVREASVLVRPHPSKGSLRAWLSYGRPRDDRLAVASFDLEETTLGAAFQRDYREMLAHADVVVGINTSAMIEAAIFGLPVLGAVVDGLIQPGQSALHYGYLADEREGLLYSSGSTAEHLARLAEALSAQEPDARSAAFVARFVRPLGVGTPALEPFLQEARALLALSVRPRSSHRLAGAVVAACARLLVLPLEERPLHRLLVVVRLALVSTWLRAESVPRRAARRTRRLRAARGR